MVDKLFHYRESMRDNNPNKLLLCFTALLIFLWSAGFQLRILQFSERYAVLRIICVFLIVLWAALRTSFADIKPLFHNFYFLSILAMLAAVMVPTFFTGTLLYGQGLDEVLRRPMFFYALFIFVPLFYYPMDVSTLKQLNAVIVVTGVSLALFQSILSFVPDIAKVILTDNAFIPERFERTRMTTQLPMYVCIRYATFYLIVVFSLRKNSIVCGLGLAILLYYLFFVFMSRRVILGSGIVLLLFYVFNPAVRKKLLLWGLLIVLLLLLAQPFVQLGIIDTIRESATSVKEEASADEGTVGGRMKGIEYYWHEFQKTWYVGIGLVSSVRGADTSVGIGLTEYNFNPADQGILSVVMQFGFQALILTGVMCHHMFRDLQFVIRSGISNMKIIALSVQLFLLFQIVTLSWVFLWDTMSIWWGLLFFITWKMRDLVPNGQSLSATQQLTSKGQLVRLAI